MAREEALLAIIHHLEAKREWNLVLDRTTEQDRDFRVIVQVRKDLQLDLQVVHSTRHEDTGLWGCDILAWAIDSKEMKDLIRLGSVQNLSPR
jgi:hypothetical protein